VVRTTAAVTRSRRRRRAGHRTVSSKPINAGAGSAAAAITRAATRVIAAHTVDHHTPNARAMVDQPSELRSSASADSFER
jgi:hypothetical protein